MNKEQWPDLEEFPDWYKMVVNKLMSGDPVIVTKTRDRTLIRRLFSLRVLSEMEPGEKFLLCTLAGIKAFECTEIVKQPQCATELIFFDESANYDPTY